MCWHPLVLLVVIAALHFLLCGREKEAKAEGEQKAVARSPPRARPRPTRTSRV